MTSPPNILVVDDTPEDLHLLMNMLKEHGCKVRPSPGGTHALKVLQHQTIDLILLDILMPGMSGYEVCRRLKSQEATREIPIIFLSALTTTDDKLQGFALGGVDYITKPFVEEEVLARVNAHLTIARLQQDLKEENDRYRGLVEATFEAILLHEDGVIVDVNAAMEQLVNVSRERLIGRNIFDLLPLQARGKARFRIGQGAETPYEITVRNAAGERITLEVQSKTIHYQGRTLHVLAMRDVSWRKTLKVLKKETEKLNVENRSLKATLHDRDHLGDLVGKNPLMQKVYERIVQAAASTEPVLISGETGTGKELAAKLIFQLSEHHSKNFVAVNCGAVQETLFEASFFGYRKGAFTNASQPMTGYFGQAEGGTLFLDEVGELSTSYIFLVSQAFWNPLSG